MRRRDLYVRLVAALDHIEPHDYLADHRPTIDEVLERLADAVDSAAERSAEAELRVTRLAAALDHVSEGVVISDAGGKVVYRNAEGTAFDGARHGDVLAERALIEVLADAVNGEQRTQSVELFGPPRRTLMLSGAPLDPGDRGLGAVATVEDVSERRRVDAIRRDFVANISHELKTPVGALGVIADALDGEDDPEIVARLVRRVQTEATRLGRIIEDLLDLSRIEDEGEPRREPVAAGLVVAQAIERVRPAAELQRITITWDEPPETLIVTGDRRQLVSALCNLLENAVKYSDPGSSVEVCVRERNGTAEFDVADHGIGIPTRDLDRVFERFYRVDKARARDTGGTGLGLAIVRHVADNHHGNVSVMSQEGEGSTFTLSIPASPEGQKVSVDG